jgi:VWFA-related protein
MRPLSLLAALLAAAAVGAGLQIVPGQLPAGPPPKPGQLGSQPSKSSQSASPASSQQTKQPAGQTTLAPEPDAQGDEATIRIGVKYVLVPTTVLDPDGHGYVNGLKAIDFGLLDNNKPQKVLAETTEQPLSVVLAIQANSDVEPVLPELRKTGTLVQGLVTGDNGDVAVLAFDHRKQVLQDFTSDPDKIQTATEKLQAGSSTSALIDAVLESDRMLLRHDPRNSRRHVILLLSRNSDKGSEARLQETVRRMQFDNAIVYCIDISKSLTAFMKKPDYPRPPAIPPEGQAPTIGGGSGPRTYTSDAQQSTGNLLNAVPPILKSIHDLFRKSPAEAFTYFTGGQVYNFATERGLESAVSDIGKDLNSQYILSYSPNNADEPGFHDIKVFVNRPGLVIRTRPGYWSVGGKQ